MKTTLSLGASRLAAFAILGISGVAMLGACSGKTAAAPVARADFSSQYAKALCESIQGCCQQGKLAYDEIACEAAEKAAVESEIPKDASIIYDANAAGDCLATLRSVASSCKDAPESAKASCERIFTGTKKPGEACSTSFDCAASSEGVVLCNGGGVTGSACVVVRPAQKGDACIGGSHVIPPTSTFGDCNSSDGPFYCEFKTSTCQPRPGIGDACVTDGDCGKGNACVEQKCAVAPKLGDACIYVCGEGLYCSDKTLTCVPQLNPGDACQATVSNPCGSEGRCSDGKCTAGLLASAGVCDGTNVQ